MPECAQVSAEKSLTEQTNKQTYSKPNTSPFALTSEWRVIIIIIRRLTSRAMSEYMTESEARSPGGMLGHGWFIRLNRWVLSRCLKVCTVGAFLMAAGISFQILGAQQLKARLPKSVVTVGALSSC